MAATVVEERRNVLSSRIPVAGALRAFGVAGLSGFVAGLIGAGFGSRLAMRIVALTAGHEHYGELTEAEERVGRISFDGSLFLIASGAVLGIIGSLLFLACRRWLPWRGWRLGLATGLLSMSAFGILVIDGDNFDFERFGSRTLNVLMFGSLFFVYGIVIATLFERTDRRIPTSRPRGLRVVPWILLLLFGAFTLLLGTGVLIAMVVGLQSPLSLVIVYLLVAAPLLARRLARRRPPMSVALVVSAFPLLLGGGYLAKQLLAIYTA